VQSDRSWRSPRSLKEGTGQTSESSAWLPFCGEEFALVLYKLVYIIGVRTRVWIAVMGDIIDLVFVQEGLRAAVR